MLLWCPVGLPLLLHHHVCFFHIIFYLLYLCPNIRCFLLKLHSPWSMVCIHERGLERLINSSTCPSRAGTRQVSLCAGSALVLPASPTFLELLKKRGAKGPLALPASFGQPSIFHVLPLSPLPCMLVPQGLTSWSAYVGNKVLSGCFGGQAGTATGWDAVRRCPRVSLFHTTLSGPWHLSLCASVAGVCPTLLFALPAVH